MLSFDLTVSNYRCFSADMPARLEIRPRLLALVGPNNAGKSTLLRLFFELRQMFSLLQDGGSIQNLANGFRHGVQFLGTGDPIEIFSNMNTLPVRIGLRIHNCLDNQISGIEFSFDRENPSSVAARFEVGPTFEEAVFQNGTFPNAIVNSTQIVVDTSVVNAIGVKFASSLYLAA